MRRRVAGAVEGAGHAEEAPVGEEEEDEEDAGWLASLLPWQAPAPSSSWGLAAAFIQRAGWFAALGASLSVLWKAYDIRMYAIRDYGPVVHEFDPWFNYRATEYLATRGWHAFFTWFDHMSWYPLGRPVATTIYPGMQFLAVAIWRLLGFLGRPWSLNDVCVYVPAWLGSVATFFTLMLTYECTGSAAAAVAGGAAMAVLPAHAARSVGGHFDNEAVAVPAMCAAFYLWCRSLRSPHSWPLAAAAGIAYSFMAASWGGYIFVPNLIGVHVVGLLVLGYEPGPICRAYGLFYLIGTGLAMRVPMVGWTPVRSLEQFLPLAVFIAVLLGAVRHVSLGKAVALAEQRRRRVGVAECLVLALAVGALAATMQAGFFQPLSGRVRALLGRHAAKTGNPLVDSVSEHQPSSASAYWTYLDRACYTAPLGCFALLLAGRRTPCPKRLAAIAANLGVGTVPSEASMFALLLAVTTYTFSKKMSRLIVFIATPAALLFGVAMGQVFDLALQPLWRTLLGPSDEEQRHRVLQNYNAPVSRLLRSLLVAASLRPAINQLREFHDACDSMVHYSLSHPQIMQKGSGGMIDDYREAYWWLRDHTPEDARILAWWDYGYHIAGMGNRTTLADGNTWNFEHIALVGLALTSPVEEAHAITRHLADYVLVWSNDVQKSTHMVKISNSVYKGHCAEADCDAFGVMRSKQPSKSLEASLVWRLTGQASFGSTDPFEEVYVSHNNKVRITKVKRVSSESRAWAADPRNRLCDAPGSWYCPGQLPPLLRQLLNLSASLENPYVPAPAGSEAAAYQAAFALRVEQQRAELPQQNGPGIPLGSYRESCRGCRMESEQRLRCTHCRMPGTPADEASLDDVKACVTGEVDNINGGLRCKPMPNDPGLPRGGYLNSCLGCRFSEDRKHVLCSDCSRSSGARIAASLDLESCVPPGRIDNHNGNLACVGLPHASNIPEGGYKWSCGGCRLEGAGETEVLQCRFCSAADGRQHKASLPVARCRPPASVDNDNGHLRCVGLPRPPLGSLPPGGYIDSCEGCRLVDGSRTLECDYCRASDGNQVPSSYEVRRCPGPGRLDNHNGRLTCVGLVHAATIPAGPYRDSCQACRVDEEVGSGPMLRCLSCRAADGRQLEAALALPGCSDVGRAIHNRDGRLTCT